jgi:hypothetical protein
MDSQSGVGQIQAQLEALKAQQEMQAKAGAINTINPGLGPGQAQAYATLGEMPEDGRPDKVKQIEWFLQQPPEVQKQIMDSGMMGGGGVTVNTGDQGMPQSLSSGLLNKGLAWDGEKLVPIPGGPADMDAQKEKKAAETVATRADSTLAEVSHAKNLISPLSAGWGGLLADLPESDARALANAIKPIKASLAFDRLQQMRNESVTGGALGQVSNIELDLLQSSVVSLDQLNKPEELERALDKIAVHYSAFTDALEGKIPATYQQAEINGEKYIKVEGQWYPL